MENEFTVAQAPAAAAKPKPNPVPPPMEDEKYGSAEMIMALSEASLVEILRDPGGSVYAKAKASMRLAAVGKQAAIPALAALLNHPTLSHYARYGLEPNPDPAASDALRAALATVKGRLLVGVINSIARRRDVKALDSLTALLKSDDAEVAAAAYEAMAHLRPPL